MEYLKQLFDQPVFTLFVIIAIGMGIGSIKVKRMSLGAAGVLFFALVFGWARQPILAACFPKDPTVAKATQYLTIPKNLTDLGLMLFVAAVGLQAGPRFFAVFRRRGMAFILVGVTSMAAAAVATFVFYKLFGLKSPEVGAGIFCGSLTNTPALAAVKDLAHGFHADDKLVAVGYGLTYPFSVISVTLFVQLLPALLRVRPQQAAAEARSDELDLAPPLERRQWRVVNPSCSGKTIEEIAAMHLSEAKISRLKHASKVVPALPGTTVCMDDIVMAVGTTEELDKLEPFVGRPVTESMADPAGHVVSEEIVVSAPNVVGKSLKALRAWEEFGVVVTRVRTDGVELSPSGDYELEPGDIVRVVGQKEDVESFAGLIGREERRLEETSLGPVALGIAAGIAIGLVAIPLGFGLSTKVSLAGGTFLVALLLGHFGRIGQMRVYVPAAAKLFARELGLVVFLAGAGSEAGTKFVEILTKQGPSALLMGALVTITTVAVAFFLLHKVLRWNMLSTAGSLSSVMTNPPALVAATHLADSDAAAVSFASLYPVAIISKIVFVQLLYLALRAL